MSDLPKLQPITRRVPPPGYRKPVYDEPTSEEAPGASHADLLRASYEDEEDDFRQRAARLATMKALVHYRWYGFTNIVNTIRIWLQARRLRRLQRAQGVQ